MTTYRIIQLTHGAGGIRDNESIEYVIERRVGILFKRWKEVILTEDGQHTRISHKSYNKAEKHLMDNYTRGYGIGSKVTQTGNVYYVEPYTMNYC